MLPERAGFVQVSSGVPHCVSRVQTCWGPLCENQKLRHEAGRATNGASSWLFLVLSVVYGVDTI